MKYLFCLLIVGGFFQARAQQPETVHSIVKQAREASWYKEQRQLWKTETEKNGSNANAWYNYYAATRALRNCASEEGKTPEEVSKLRKEYHESCDNIAAAALKQVPASFEANYINFWNSDIVEGEAFVLKAYEINPNDARIFDEMMMYYELKGEKEKHEQFAAKLFQINEFPASMLNWSYNLLAELDDKAIVLTVGDNDTYVPWVVQAAKQFRKDVTVVNFNLITIDSYRNLIFKQLGIQPMDFKMNSSDPEGFSANRDKVIDYIFKNSGRPVYVSTTGINEFEAKWGDSLFLTGLAYKYSKESFDNISVIRRNYEKRYLLDYLKESFSTSISDEIGQRFNGTYLPSMIKLYQHYKESEETSKQKELEELLLKISQETGQQSEILDLLGETGSANRTFQMTMLNVKDIEKNMVLVDGNQYIGAFEVTNGEYAVFLNNLLTSKKLDLYKQCLYDSIQWEQKFEYSIHDPMTDLYHWHPAYASYPLVNITYESAVAYCEWLTAQYNLQRRRNWSQVRFRLPTEEEWRYVAGNRNNRALTPFENDSIKACATGCYQANIKTGPQRFFDDGGFHTVKVKSYPPSKLGLYNMLGNAAEMTMGGTIKGGSWADLFDQCKFDQSQTFSLPDPRVGFRIVMEVIEP